ncbi:hypothetical protein AKO1_008749 [Acrasis kona]|uniref:dual-specificity kinase n=1 Tax=Acrasis kona TaxID=1008807 RepID=A0AAW2ZE90_9EUKA
MGHQVTGTPTTPLSTSSSSNWMNHLGTSSAIPINNNQISINIPSYNGPYATQLPTQLQNSPITSNIPHLHQLGFTQSYPDPSTPNMTYPNTPTYSMTQSSPYSQPGIYMMQQQALQQYNPVLMQQQMLQYQTQHQQQQYHVQHQQQHASFAQPQQSQKQQVPYNHVHQNNIPTLHVKHEPIYKKESVYKNNDDTIVYVDDDDDDADDGASQEDHDAFFDLREEIGFQQTDGRLIQARKLADDRLLRRDESERPVYKLSVHLLKTYKNINTVYYTEKRKREQITQQQQQQQLQLLQKQHAQQQQFIMQQHAQQQQQQQQQQRYIQLQAQQAAQQQVQQRLIEYTKPIHNNGYDDEQGNYIVQLNEEMDGRYTVQESMGKGSFGVVVKAFDRVNQELVAVKIIKNKNTFYAQAKIEIQILQDLNAKDKNNKYNIVQFKQMFQWRNHLCIVFELLSYNLYDLLKYTQFRGVSLTLIRKFAQQLLYTLHFLSRPEVNVIHCDLKPENILLKNHRKSIIKVIDFGSSCYVNKKMYKYIQSRFYRSPEVLLGLPYDTSIDMWSFGCILVEMHTGIPLFDGKNETDQMHKIIQVLGMPPHSMIERAPKKERFFQWEPSTRSYTCIKQDIKPGSKTLCDVIGVNTHGPDGRRTNAPGHSYQDYTVFHDLVLKVLRFHPAERLLPFDALQHDFFRLNGTTTTTTSNGDLITAYNGRSSSALNDGLSASVNSSPVMGMDQHSFYGNHHHVPQQQQSNVTAAAVGGIVGDGFFVSQQQQQQIHAPTSSSSSGGGHHHYYRAQI